MYDAFGEYHVMVIVDENVADLFVYTTKVRQHHHKLTCETSQLYSNKLQYGL
jgi:hypothetical protein